MKTATPSRRGVQSLNPLPESEETKYKLKCIELRKRTREIEQHNELMALSIARTRRDVKRLRLERALLLEKLEDRTQAPPAAGPDPAGAIAASPSPPNSPSTSIGKLSSEMLDAAAATVVAAAQKSLQMAAAAAAAAAAATAASNATPPTNGAASGHDSAAHTPASNGRSKSGASSKGGSRGRGSKNKEAALASQTPPPGSAGASLTASASHLHIAPAPSDDSHIHEGSPADMSFGDHPSGDDALTDELGSPGPLAVAAAAAAAAAVATPSGLKKRSHAPRDPNLPRRPQNAYIIFCELEKESVRARMEKERPGLSYDMTKAMSDAWHALPRSARDKYYKIYTADKERYTREMANYLPTNPTPSEQREQLRFRKAYQDLLEKKEKEGKPGEEDEDEDEDDEDKLSHYESEEHLHEDESEDKPVAAEEAKAEDESATEVALEPRKEDAEDSEEASTKGGAPAEAADEPDATKPSAGDEAAAVADDEEDGDDEDGDDEELDAEHDEEHEAQPEVPAADGGPEA